MTRHNKKRGFNLIEAAIVLAVVGGVIGGIWVAASTMYENYKVNKTVEGVFTIARNIQSSITQNEALIIGDIHIENTVREMGLVPIDWVNNDQIVNPFGGKVLVRISIYDDKAAFSLNLYETPKTACIKALVRLSTLAKRIDPIPVSGSGDDARMFARKSIRFLNVTGGGGISNPYVFPYSIDQAKNACDSDSNTISVSFNYTRIN